MHIRTNSMKQKLQDGATVFGVGARLPEPGMVEILGYAGLDYVRIDGEHGSIGWTEMERMILAAYAVGITPIVRIHENNAAMIMRALDLGAMGILVPHCRNGEDAQQIVNGAFYPPQGNRGVGPGRSIKFGAVSTEDYYANINDEVVVAAMIEDSEAIENINEIVEIEGIDVLSIGTSDLAASLGVTGQTSHPKVVEASEKVLTAATRRGIAVGCPARTVEEGLQVMKRGFRVISCGNAETFLLRSVQQHLRALQR